MGANNTNNNLKEKLKKESKKSEQKFNDMMDKNLERKKEKIMKEREGNMKVNLTIRVYSDGKCPENFVNYLNKIKMEDWKISYLDNGFSKEKTDKLIDEYKKKSKEKKNYDEVLVIVIDSYESFINILKEDSKNFLKDFNENLYPEEQPFFFFINKSLDDFEYIKFKAISLEEDDSFLGKFSKIAADFISDNKEEYNISICYDIEYKEDDLIISLIEAKNERKDNFNIVFGNDMNFIFGELREGEINKNFIYDILKNKKHLTIKNFDSNIKLEDDFELLKKITKVGKVKFYFECSKPKFTKLFEDYLTSYELLDRRNFDVQSYYINPYRKFQKFCGYYHEYGDALIKDKFVKYPSKINIGVCGRAGAGKSTLLNVILGEKRCLEGQGTSVSNFIVTYSHPNYPINLIDFPGFGDKNHAENLIKKIKEKNNQLNNIKEQFHVIIYCIKFGERTFLDKEEDVIYELMKLNVKIIFVFTKGDKEESNAFKRFKNTFLKDLSNLLRKIETDKIKKTDKKKEINIEEYGIDIVSIYSMKEESHGNIIEPFGLDTLFEKIYNYLKEKKIQDWVFDTIDSATNEKELDELINTTELMKINKSRKEIISSIRNRVTVIVSFFLSKFILSFPKYYFKNLDDLELTLKSEGSELIYEVSCAYCQSLDKDEAVRLSNKVISSIKELFNGGSMKEELGDIPFFMRIVGLVVFPISFVITGILVASCSRMLTNMLCDAFEEDGKINIKSYLKQFAEGLNEGIEGTNKISKEFKESYKK